MGMMKNYLLNLLQQCSEEQFGQDAIEWAITSGMVKLTYDSERDIRETMSRYDEIIEAYRRGRGQVVHTASTKPAPMVRAVPEKRPKTATAERSPKKKRAA